MPKSISIAATRVSEGKLTIYDPFFGLEPEFVLPSVVVGVLAVKVMSFFDIQIKHYLPKDVCQRCQREA
jgi:hypothetical protein